jgi:adenine-specific DNA-methyltransferase
MVGTKGNHKAREIDQYDHRGQTRLNNPPVGLVTPETDRLNGKTRYDYDPHLDPRLTWAGKTEHLTFEVPRVSLHVHERVDPATIIRALRNAQATGRQMSLFEFSEENPPLREAIEFYKHQHNWSNRLVAGDSLLVMNSLLQKEGMAEKVQMIYLDPPYGVKYGSNFQPFINRRVVEDGKDEDLTQEPEMVRAFRDTWELGIHSYLTYLRDRLLLARELLSPTGSMFVQISDENLHHVKELMDEVFGAQNFVVIITFRKTGGEGSSFVGTTCDFILWYARDKGQAKFHPLFQPKIPGEAGATEYVNVELQDHSIRRMTEAEVDSPELLPKGSKVFATWPIVSPGYSQQNSQPIELQYGKASLTLRCPPNRHWSVGVEGTKKLWQIGRLLPQEGQRIFKRYLSDFPLTPLGNQWTDTRGAIRPLYVVQTATAVVERCLLMTTDPGNLVFDPTCGSGTTAYCAERWGRRWITCDTSRVATALARQRLMTAVYDWYQLAHPDEGVSSCFRYRKVPHVSLRSLASDSPADSETLYDQPEIDKNRMRVAGPFTVEAVPAPSVQSIGYTSPPVREPADTAVTREGETVRQEEWRAEILRTGIRGKGGQFIEFSRVEPLPATRWLHADAELRSANSERAVISFGPSFAPLEPRQVGLAVEEAQTLVPKPKLIVFAAFQFDPEAAKDIDETAWAGVSLLKVQMNPDLFTDDLKKRRASNESFWLIGQPDIKLSRIREGKDKGKFTVEVCGFDYYNTKSGSVESGGTDKIALWLLDTDYDGRSLFPRQIFLPLSGEREGWSRMARTLRSEINEEAAEAYRGTVSLPFEPGNNRRVAVKLIDDRGIESLKVIVVD